MTTCHVSPKGRRVFGVVPSENVHMHRIRLVVLALVLFGSSGALAQPPGGGEPPGSGPGGRRGPPPEAVAACRQGSDGAACTFTAPHGRVDGTCRIVREGDLACVPAGHRPGEGRGQPPGRMR